MSETPAERTNRLNANRGNGVLSTGQFGHSLQGEATPTRPISTLLDERPKPTFDEVITSITDGSYFLGDLTYVSQGDELTEDQQTAYLAGDWETFDESITEAFDDQRYDTTLEYAKQATDELGLDWDDLDEEDQDSIKDAISDKDDSDPSRQLLRNTGSKLLRIPLVAKPFADLVRTDGMEDPAWGMHSLNSDDPRGNQARFNAISAILAAHAVDITDPDVKDNIRELVDNGPYDWHEAVTLDVIVYSGLVDAAAAPYSDSDAPGSTGRDLNFTGVRVVLLDPWNGSGHDVSIPGNLSVRVTPEKPAVLDSASDGYGWDDVAGVVKSAYAPTKMTSAWVVPAE